MISVLNIYSRPASSIIPKPALCTLRARISIFSRYINNMADLTAADNSTPLYTLEGLRVQAKCTAVYDGDTAYFAFRVAEGAPIYRYKCRMAGYNSAELRTRDPVEKAAGIAAKNALSADICDKIVTLSIGKYDKYGRLLVEVFHSGENINKKMVTGGFGKPYDGRGEKQW